MATKFWVEFVESTDIGDTTIREGYYDDSVLTVLLSCQKLDLFEIQPEYALGEVVYLEGQGVGDAPHRIKIYVRRF
ncbi:TPA: hypothetical protein QCW56_002338 [Bacillus cereus]|nr:hypothetical protein [Bacillus cereus]HDR8047174.1 hypothetical protein [Bacillus cereus]